jgi:hypothetical protein
MKKLLFFFSLFIIFSCEDNQEDKIRETVALLRWSGDYAVDGCGFFIDIEDHEYKPEDETTIDDSLKISSGVEVIVRYELLDEKIEYYCGDLSNSSEIDGIKLHSIRKN